MRQTLIAILMWLSCATTAVATCDGASFFDRLTPAERALLDERVGATPFAEGLLWTAMRGATTLTLVGTLHIHDVRFAPLMDTLGPIISKADLVLLEATAETEQEMQAALAANPSLIFIGDGPTLPEQLSDATWASIAAAARERGVPSFLAAKMQPWYLSLTLAIPPCAAADLAQGRRGLDHLIMRMAEASDVPMQALEDWTTLFDLLADGTFEEQIDMLRLGILSPELHQEMIVAMLDAYFAGEVARIWEASRLSARYIPNFDREEAEALFDETQVTLLDGRNLAWIPVIEAAAKQHQRIVVASGAAHLPGAGGLLRLLEQRGWQIAPLD